MSLKCGSTNPLIRTPCLYLLSVTNLQLQHVAPEIKGKKNGLVASEEPKSGDSSRYVPAPSQQLWAGLHRRTSLVLQIVCASKRLCFFFVNSGSFCQVEGHHVSYMQLLYLLHKPQHSNSRLL